MILFKKIKQYEELKAVLEETLQWASAVELDVTVVIHGHPRRGMASGKTYPPEEFTRYYNKAMKQAALNHIPKVLEDMERELNELEAEIQQAVLSSPPQEESAAATKATVDSIRTRIQRSAK